jgi:hypothetical protein
MFRNGLMIALLAYCPIRPKKLANRKQTLRSVRVVPQAAVSNRSKVASLSEHFVGERDHRIRLLRTRHQRP